MIKALIQFHSKFVQGSNTAGNPQNADDFDSGHDSTADPDNRA